MIGQGYCHVIEYKLSEKDFLALNTWNLSFWMLFPVFIFFLLNNPHDCYTCLGKDPDRIYSIYQLTQEECVKKQIIARFNQSEVSKRFAEQSFVISLRRSTFKRQSSNFETAKIVQRNFEDEQLNPLADSMLYRLAGSQCESES